MGTEGFQGEVAGMVQVHVETRRCGRFWVAWSRDEPGIVAQADDERGAVEQLIALCRNLVDRGVWPGYIATTPNVPHAEWIAQAIHPPEGAVSSPATTEETDG